MNNKKLPSTIALTLVETSIGGILAEGLDRVDGKMIIPFGPNIL